MGRPSATLWAEFYGGPADGHMDAWLPPFHPDRDQPSKFEPASAMVIIRPDHVVVVSRDELRHYRLRGWADRDLGIARLAWEPAKAA